MTRRNRAIHGTILTIVLLAIFSQASWAESTYVAAWSGGAGQADTLRAPDTWFAHDKLEHLIVSAFLSGTCCSILRDFYNNSQESSVYFSASFTLGVGLGKELHDLHAPTGRFSYKDLIADIVGIGLGLFVATR